MVSSVGSRDVLGFQLPETPASPDSGEGFMGVLGIQGWGTTTVAETLSLFVRSLPVSW